MENEIDLKADFLTFREQIKEKFGDSYADQADLFFERAVSEAKLNLEHSAIADGEFALSLAYYASDDFPLIYMIGFLCELCIFADKIIKAKAYYNLGVLLLDKDSDMYEMDKEEFDRLKDLLDGEEWKENNESNNE